MFERGRMSVQLPQGWQRPRQPAGARGAPPLEQRAPARLLYAAWLKECGGDTSMQIARALRFPLDGLRGDTASARAKVTRYIKRGRSLAATLGIWPWASWAEGKPAQRDWWSDPACSEWLQEWLAAAQGQALLARTKRARRALIEPQLLIAEALERKLLEPAALTARYRAALLDQATDSLLGGANAESAET